MQVWRTTNADFERVLNAFRQYALGQHPLMEQVRLAADRASYASSARRDSMLAVAHQRALSLSEPGLPVLRLYDVALVDNVRVFVPAQDSWSLFANASRRHDAWGSDEIQFDDTDVTLSDPQGINRVLAGSWIDHPVLVLEDVLLAAVPRTT